MLCVSRVDEPHNMHPNYKARGHPPASLKCGCTSVAVSDVTLHCGCAHTTSSVTTHSTSSISSDLNVSTIESVQFRRVQACSLDSHRSQLACAWSGCWHACSLLDLEKNHIGDRAGPTRGFPEVKVMTVCELSGAICDSQHHPRCTGSESSA